ncbi:SCO4225 family membrane protein [Streptomyces sp. NPDC059467]|uniref:SCO4225 family membrane protein n=1 Tax=Streptomyces sp. NPDC059467 TaxID=3346844 RepID=UPI00369CEC98
MNSTRALLSALRTPVALGYLALVAAVVVWVGADTLFVEHADASLAGVWAFLVTAPTSLLFVMLPGPLAWAGVVVGAVVQAAVLGVLYRKVSGRFGHRTGPSNA